MLALSMIPILSRHKAVDYNRPDEFEALRSRAFALLPQVWKFYLKETDKTRLLAELFTRDNLDLHCNSTARGLIGHEVVVAHDAARDHFENWLHLHELVDARCKSDLSVAQFRRAKSIVHEVELFLEHEAAVRECIAQGRADAQGEVHPFDDEPPTGAGEKVTDSPAHDVLARAEAFADE